jgi:hypothetical protein
VKERQVNSALDSLVGGVDGVAGQQKEIGARGLELVALCCQQITDPVPPPRALVAFDRLEIGLRQYEARAVQAAVAQALGDEFIDDAVVRDRTGPCDAADEPDGFHSSAPGNGGANAVCMFRAGLGSRGSGTAAAAWKWPGRCRPLDA